jgi:hypothetical protein
MFPKDTLPKESVGQALKVEQENKRNRKEPCWTSSDIGSEQENHNVEQSPT